MSGLYPTPTRLRLLADVDAGYVVRGNSGVYLWDPVAGMIAVTRRVRTAERAGWVEPGQQPGQKVWLTDEGRAVRERARAMVLNHRRAD